MRSRHQRLPGVGREQGRHQGLILSKIVEKKVVWDVKVGSFQLFPDGQDHLGEVQTPKTARSRP